MRTQYVLEFRHSCVIAYLFWDICKGLRPLPHSINFDTYFTASNPFQLHLPSGICGFMMSMDTAEREIMIIGWTPATEGSVSSADACKTRRRNNRLHIGLLSNSTPVLQPFSAQHRPHRSIEDSWWIFWESRGLARYVGLSKQYCTFEL